MFIKVIDAPEGLDVFHQITLLLKKTVIEYVGGSIKIKDGNYEDIVKLAQNQIIVERIS